MKFTFKFALCCVAFTFCAGLARAQGRPTACPLPPPSPFKHNALIATSYDATAARMRTTLKHPLALTDAAHGGGRFFFYASFLHGGKRTADDAPVEIAFISVGEHQAGRGKRNLRVVADGNECAPSGAIQYRSVTNEHGLTLTLTQGVFFYDTLAKIIRAGKVEVSLDDADFQLTENHLEALRELASLMRQRASEWTTR